MIPCFVVICAMVAHFVYFRHQKSNRRETVMRLPSGDDDYALNFIGKDSVFSYFATDNLGGWLVALVTLSMQFITLFIFVRASEANLQKDTIDVQFTWKCPRDTEVCSDGSDTTSFGWVIFAVLMIGFLAKDFINGSRLIYHSTKPRHDRKSRMRYFIGGTSLCLLSSFALYVSDCKDICAIMFNDFLRFFKLLLITHFCLST